MLTMLKQCRPAETDLVPAGQALAVAHAPSRRSVAIVEPRIGGRRPDVVAASAGAVIAVELKVDDWLRGLTQAVSNLLFADYSYLAIWEGAVRRVDLAAIDSAGVGLASVTDDGRFEILVRAPRSRYRAIETAYDTLKTITDGRVAGRA